MNSGWAPARFSTPTNHLPSQKGSTVKIRSDKMLTWLMPFASPNLCSEERTDAPVEPAFFLWDY